MLNLSGIIGKWCTHSKKEGKYHMMPNSPANAGSPPGQTPGQPSQVSPQEVKQQLIMLLTKAKQLAEANGVNFMEIVQAVMKGGMSGGQDMSQPSAPPPPPGAMPSQAG